MKHGKGLDELISRFKGAIAAESEARWTQGKIVSEIKDRFGQKGIAVLAAEVGMSQRKLDSLGRTYERIPLALRRKHQHVAWSYFRSAAMIIQRFPKGSPEADPDFWLTAAVENGWDSDGMRAAALIHTSMSSPDSLEMRNRIAWLQRKAKAASQAFKNIQAAVAVFNKEHAAYYGASLEIRTKATIDKAS